MRRPVAWVRQCGRVTPLRKRWSDRKGLLLDALSRHCADARGALGIKTNPAFAGTYEYRANADFAALFPRFLDRLPDGGVVMCHPGFVDAELAAARPADLLARARICVLRRRRVSADARQARRGAGVKMRH